MASHIRLNHKGIEQILKSAPMAAAVKGAAEAIAENVRAQGIKVGDVEKGPGSHDVDLPVTVTMVTTDRAHGIVALAHPAGDAVQAKHGALTKAAKQVGLDVREKK